jgi:hypothetical protein
MTPCPVNAKINLGQQAILTTAYLWQRKAMVYSPPSPFSLLFTNDHKYVLQQLRNPRFGPGGGGADPINFYFFFFFNSPPHDILLLGIPEEYRATNEKSARMAIPVSFPSLPSYYSLISNF